MLIEEKTHKGATFVWKLEVACEITPGRSEREETLSVQEVSLCWLHFSSIIIAV